MQPKPTEAPAETPATAPVETAPPAAEPAAEAAPPAEAPRSVAELRAAALAKLTEGGDPEAPAPAETPAETTPSQREVASVTETTPTEPPKTPEPNPLEDRFAALVREKAALRKEREEWEAQRKAGQPEVPELAAIRRAKESGSPIQALMALGFTFEQAAEEALRGGPKQTQQPKEAPELKALREEVEALRQESKQRSQREEQAQQQAARAADVRVINDFATKAGEQYELVVAHGRVEQVYDVLLQRFQENQGEWEGGSPQAAMERALAQVQGQLEREADALLRTQWAQKRLSSAAPQQASPRPQAANGQTPKTLSNTHAAAAPPPAERPLTREELRQRALNVLTKG